MLFIVRSITHGFWGLRGLRYIPPRRKGSSTQRQLPRPPVKTVCSARCPPGTAGNPPRKTFRHLVGCWQHNGQRPCCIAAGKQWVCGALAAFLSKAVVAEGCCP